VIRETRLEAVCDRIGARFDETSDGSPRCRAETGGELVLGEDDAGRQVATLTNGSKSGRIYKRDPDWGDVRVEDSAIVVEDAQGFYRNREYDDATVRLDARDGFAIRSGVSAPVL